MPANLTYVITGGCGFLGSHLVRMLLERDEHIRELRVVDKTVNECVTPCEKVHVYEADIRSKERMSEICSGADVIIHAASLIDVPDGTFTQEELWDVNVRGTENLLNCCLATDVKCLVYTSSVDAFGPNWRGDPLEDGVEESPYDRTHLSSAYGTSKMAAESLVLEFNGRTTKDGGKLRTCALRPPHIYGEGSKLDLSFVKLSKLGTRISSPDVKARQAYVGNVALAHLLAADKLVSPDGIACGRVYNIHDDTPITNYQDFFEYLCPDVKIHEKMILPLWLLYFIAGIFGSLRLLLKPFCNFVPPLSRAPLLACNTTFYLNCAKARKDLGYSPIYAWEQSRQRTADWIEKQLTE
ncbi:3 beta-hydroxysteroid dehydrogenase type 7-like [Branchiostoma floridae]|nr:3 beta-hydroxysteroid dehydrogenase type 7-like [Branchiostoma floridae]XP_035693210.1 3 beta-hydroxysteroid dehydrogenase type 7-like [Branchiostoma floridae]XP_035693211.1 3 beta-hydroxysteroid dehydrogenase type 7-like [Branchiostoma floridae]